MGTAAVAAATAAVPCQQQVAAALAAAAALAGRGPGPGQDAGSRLQEASNPATPQPAANVPGGRPVVVHVTTDVSAMPFPEEWPKTLPAANYSKQQLEQPYHLAKVLPGWQSSSIPLVADLPLLKQWCQSAVDTSRPRGYRAVRDVTYEKTEDVLMQVMGFCFSHRGYPSTSLSCSLLSDPHNLAAFTSFLLARGLTEGSMRTVTAQLTKVLTWMHSISQVRLPSHACCCGNHQCEHAVDLLVVPCQQHLQTVLRAIVRALKRVVSAD